MTDTSESVAREARSVSSPATAGRDAEIRQAERHRLVDAVVAAAGRDASEGGEEETAYVLAVGLIKAAAWDCMFADYKAARNASEDTQRSDSEATTTGDA